MPEDNSQPLTRADLDRAVETIVGELAKCLTRDEAATRFTRIDSRLDRIENRLDRMSENLQLVQAAIAITNRWADNLDKSVSKEITDLQRRVEALERKAS